MTVEWHGDEANGLVRRKLVQALTRAAITIRRRAAELLSVAGSNEAEDEKRPPAFYRKTYVNVPGETTKAGKPKRVRKTAPHWRSKPGDPPRKQSGRLRGSVAYEVDPETLTARVGTNVEYGKHLELGTSRGLAPRPWLRRAALEVRGRLGQLLARLGD